MSVVDLPAPSRSSEAAALWEAMASRGQVISPVPQVVGRLAIPEGFHDDIVMALCLAWSGIKTTHDILIGVF